MHRLLSVGVLATSFWQIPLVAQTAGISPFAARKAESMLRSRLPCLGCHALNGEGGQIGPDLTTVRERRSAAYIAAMVADPQRVVPGSAMPRTEMPEAIRELIIAYLIGRPATTRAPEAPAPTLIDAPATAVVDGAALYARWCAACHGTRGKGDGPNAKALLVPPAQHASRKAMELRSDDALYDAIAGGGAVVNRSPRMPAFGATLTDREMRALVAHIRTLCGCEGPAWSNDGTGMAR